MKILFCANIYETGFVGPARLAEGLLKINDLYRGQNELRVLTADVKVGQFPVYKMKVQYPRFLRFFDFWFRGWAFYKGILRVKKEFDFDIVLFGNATYGLVAKVLQKQFLIGGFINDYNIVSVTWGNFYKHEGGKSLVLLNRIEKLCANKLDFVIVCSWYLHQLVREEYRCSPEKLFVLYQGIDLEKIPFRPRGISQSATILILFVKYRFRLGGLHVLAQALEKLEEFKFRLTVLGPPLEAEPEIAGWFEKIPHVTLDFRGAVSQEIVHRELASHDILCIPASFEGLGLANVEGLAHGISVVSTNAGGIPEVLDNGKNGWLCEPGNLYSLANSIRDCINAYAEERLEKLNRGRRFAEQYFDYTVMLEKFLSILAEQIQKRRSDS